MTTRLQSILPAFDLNTSLSTPSLDDLNAHHIGRTFDDPTGLFDRIGSTRPATCAPFTIVDTALLFHHLHHRHSKLGAA